MGGVGVARPRAESFGPSGGIIASASAGSNDGHKKARARRAEFRA